MKGIRWASTTHQRLAKLVTLWLLLLVMFTSNPFLITGAGSSELCRGRDRLGWHTGDAIGSIGATWLITAPSSERSSLSTSSDVSSRLWQTGRCVPLPMPMPGHSSNSSSSSRSSSSNSSPRCPDNQPWRNQKGSAIPVGEVWVVCEAFTGLEAGSDITIGIDDTTIRIEDRGILQRGKTRRSSRKKEVGVSRPRLRERRICGRYQFSSTRTISEHGLSWMRLRCRPRRNGMTSRSLDLARLGSFYENSSRRPWYRRLVTIGGSNQSELHRARQVSMNTTSCARSSSWQQGTTSSILASSPVLKRYADGSSFGRRGMLFGSDKTGRR